MEGRLELERSRRQYEMNRGWDIYVPAPVKV